MKKLDRIDNLNAGDDVSFRLFSSTKKIDRKLKYNFCWKDNYDNQDVLILAKPDNWQILSYIYPKNSFTSEKNKLIVDLDVMNNERCNMYLYFFAEREHSLLYRTIKNKQEPSQEEIENFRNSKLYLNFFGKTPAYELLITNFHENNGL